MTTNPLERAVLGLVVSHQDYDADRPWVKRSPAVRTAQATLVEGQLLLTSAQMIAGATMIEVEREGRPPRAAARVVHVDRELNLALLAVDAPGFLDGMHALPLAAATPTAGTLSTVRWNNQQFEVVGLRVKRMGVTEVWYGRMRHAFLLARSDLSGGGWAEPVVDGGELVGLTTSQDDHTASIVPVEILAAYLALARDPDRYVGFPMLRFSWQWTMDPALAAWLGLGDHPRGVMVRQVPRGSTGDGVLRPRDVLLSLDGHAIDSRGYYLHPRYGWIEFTHIVVDGHLAGDVVQAQVLRDGQPLDLELELRPYPTAIGLLPLRRGDEAPPYVIVGGLVFLELDGDLMRTWGAEWWATAPTRLVTTFYLEESRQTPERRRIVVLAQVLPSAWSIGYQNCRDLLVSRIDGRPIDGLADVVEAFASAAGPFARIEFQPNEERSSIVVATEGLDALTAETLADYGIPNAHRLPAPLPPLDR